MPAKSADLRRMILDKAGRGSADKRGGAERCCLGLGRARRTARPRWQGQRHLYFAPEVRHQLKRLAADADRTYEFVSGNCNKEIPPAARDTLARIYRGGGSYKFGRAPRARGGRGVAKL